MLVYDLLDLYASCECLDLAVGWELKLTVSSVDWNQGSTKIARARANALIAQGLTVETEETELDVVVFLCD